MAKQRLNHDDAFKSIMGKNSDVVKEKEARSTIKQDEKEKLIQTAFYITEKQRKAMKIKTALGDKPEDKDLSSIVRAALDTYLADIIINL